MKKEQLTKEDRMILKKQRQAFSFPVLFVVLIVLGLCGYYIYYFRENYFEHYYRSYILDLVMITLIGIVITGMFITFKIEIFLGYKYVFVGYIKSKKIIENDGATYHFFINERKITVSKEDYEKYKRGQKIKVELTPLSKQTIRVSSIN